MALGTVIDNLAKRAPPAFLIAGHVVLDQIVDTKDQRLPRLSLGGPVPYSSLTLASLGRSCEVRTKIGADFPELFVRLLSARAGVDVDKYRVLNFKTTRYQIDRTYSPRKLWLLAKCKPLSISDFAPFLGDTTAKPKTLILNTVANEISLPLLERVSKEFELVMADSQGFVRKLPRDGSEITLKNGLDISCLSGVDVLKADEAELAAWSGTKDKESSLRQVSKFVEVILMTSGPGIVDLYQKGNCLLRARPFEIKVEDTTGAGDIMLAAFASGFSDFDSVEEALQMKNLEKTLSFSVAAATLSVQRLGVEKAFLSAPEVERMARTVKLIRP